MGGNPLLNQQTSGNFKVKRRYRKLLKQTTHCCCVVMHCRWDDDVVFKNCAKGVDDKPKVGGAH